jgi:hypothetical protein
MGIVESPRKGYGEEFGVVGVPIGEKANGERRLCCC